MDELEFLKQRRSIRKFKKEPISSTAIRSMEELAILAPSARNEQAWFFIVLQSEEIIQQLAEMIGNAHVFYDAPALIVAFAKQDAIASEIDVTFALSNMMNAAVAEGLGTCFIYALRDLFNHPAHRELKQVCGVPEGYSCIGGLAVGVPDETKEIPTDRHWDVFSHIQ